MDRHSIKMTFDGRLQVLTSPMTSLKSVRKRRQQLYARDVRCLVFVLFLSSGRRSNQQIVFSVFFKVQIMFAHISRPDKHADLLKIHFKPLVIKLKFSTLVA